MEKKINSFKLDKYKTQVHEEVKDTYVPMLAGMAAMMEGVLEERGISSTVLPTCQAPDDVNDIFVYNGRTFSHAIGILKSKVPEDEIMTLLNEMYPQRHKEEK